MVCANWEFKELIVFRCVGGSTGGGRQEMYSPETWEPQVPGAGKRFRVRWKFSPFLCGKVCL